MAQTTGGDKADGFGQKKGKQPTRYRHWVSYTDVVHRVKHPRLTQQRRNLRLKSYNMLEK
jgi:hypothetical protein